MVVTILVIILCAIPIYIFKEVVNGIVKSLFGVGMSRIAWIGALTGGWLGGRVWLNISTDSDAFTLVLVGAVVGGLLGAGLSKLITTVRGERPEVEREYRSSQYREESIGRILSAIACIPLCAIGGGLMGIYEREFFTPDANENISLIGFTIGLFLGLHQAAAGSAYRNAKTVLLLGAVAGALVTLSGGIKPVSRAISAASERGIQAAVESGMSGEYLREDISTNRDRRAIAGAIAGASLVAFVGAVIFCWRNLNGNLVKVPLRRPSRNERKSKQKQKIKGKFKRFSS